eukprot:906459-Heterocapsa_arctica.AAC.1
MTGHSYYHHNLDEFNRRARLRAFAQQAGQAAQPAVIPQHYQGLPFYQTLTGADWTPLYGIRLKFG